jgi:hypothetical protein
MDAAGRRERREGGGMAERAGERATPYLVGGRAAVARYYLITPSPRPRTDGIFSSVSSVRHYEVD